MQQISLGGMPPDLPFIHTHTHTHTDTQAERARQEALASFGGMDFSSVTVRKRDLRDELRRDAQVTKEGQDGGNRVKHKTRLQAAKEESSALFNDVVFGERRTRKRRQ